MKRVEKKMGGRGENMTISAGGCEVRIAELTQVFQGKIAELTNDLQRTRADFENYRKQVEVQRENAAKTAKFATVMKLLPLVDDIDRAVVNYPGELGPVSGVLAKTMNELELAKIKTDEGTEFNPDIHDAVMVEGEGEKEVVAETLRTGYYYQGEVLRPAMVKVKRI